MRTRTIGRRRRPEDEQDIAGALQIGDRRFPFELKRRTIDLGPDGDVDYFYMPSAELRSTSLDRESTNFRSCIQYSFARAEPEGLRDDPVEQASLAGAYCYPLINKSKSRQGVYLDAYLPPGRFDENQFQLTMHETDAIKKAVAAGTPAAIRAELDRALRAQMPAEAEKDLLMSMYKRWIGNGAIAWRKSGQAGLDAWRAEIDDWMSRYRRNSKTPPFVRQFINYFAAQVQVHFFRTYANFWSGLLPWLREHYDVNENSLTFMSVWHCQNQPVPFADKYREPDALRGHVLALHPLSWVLLSVQELREAVGAAIVGASNRRPSSGEVTEVGFDEAILTAAHLYGLAYETFKSSR